MMHAFPQSSVAVLCRVRCTLLLLLAVTALPAFAGEVPVTQPAAGQIEVKAADGHAVRPFAFPPSQKAAVLIFVATDCPISNSYAPTLARIAKDVAGQGVAFYVVYSDADTTPDAAQAHHQTYHLPGTALLDPGHQLSALTGVTVTPTVVIITAGGVVKYAGAIDDQYAAVGRKRFAATQHYLVDAVNQIIADKPITTDRTTPIGCAIP